MKLPRHLAPLLLLGFIFPLALPLSTNSSEEQFYQVINTHPELDRVIQENTQTIERSGRLWIVTTEKKLPERLQKFLAPVQRDSVKTYYPKFTKEFEPDSVVQATLEQVSISKIKNTVEWISQFETRKIFTDDNLKCVSKLNDQFKFMGLKSEIKCTRDVCNVLAVKKGKSAQPKTILIMAHLDSVGESKAGADDNGTGIAALLEMARILAPLDTQNNIQFLATNGEEENLDGSTDYANELQESGEIKNISLAINMDMVGYNSNHILEIETDRWHKDMAQWYSELVVGYSHLKPKITIGAWGSDHVPFLERGVPTLLTIEFWDTKTPCYHQACDLPKTVNYEYTTQITKLNLAAVLHQDKK